MVSYGVYDVEITRDRVTGLHFRVRDPMGFEVRRSYTWAMLNRLDLSETEAVKYGRDEAVTDLILRRAAYGMAMDTARSTRTHRIRLYGGPFDGTEYMVPAGPDLMPPSAWLGRTAAMRPFDSEDVPDLTAPVPLDIRDWVYRPDGNLPGTDGVWTYRLEGQR